MATYSTLDMILSDVDAAEKNLNAAKRAHEDAVNSLIQFCAKEQMYQVLKVDIAMLRRAAATRTTETLK